MWESVTSKARESGYWLIGVVSSAHNTGDQLTVTGLSLSLSLSLYLSLSLGMGVCVCVWGGATLKR